MPGAFVSFVREPTAANQLDKIVLCTFGVIADTTADLFSRFGHMSGAASVNRTQTVNLQMTDSLVLQTYTTDTYLRQKVGRELDFVTIDNSVTQPIVSFQP